MEKSAKGEKVRGREIKRGKQATAHQFVRLGFMLVSDDIRVSTAWHDMIVVSLDRGVEQYLGPAYRTCLLW